MPTVANRYQVHGSASCEALETAMNGGFRLVLSNMSFAVNLCSMELEWSLTLYYPSQ